MAAQEDANNHFNQVTNKINMNRIYTLITLTALTAALSAQPGGGQRPGQGGQRPGGDRGQRPGGDDRGRGDSGNRGEVRREMMPQSLRMGLIETLGRISTNESEAALVKILDYSGSGVEVNLIDRMLTEYRPGDKVDPEELARLLGNLNFAAIVCEPGQPGASSSSLGAAAEQLPAAAAAAPAERRARSGNKIPAGQLPAAATAAPAGQLPAAATAAPAEEALPLPTRWSIPAAAAAAPDDAAGAAEPVAGATRRWLGGVSSRRWLGGDGSADQHRHGDHSEHGRGGGAPRTRLHTSAPSAPPGAPPRP